jgi:mannosidase alpha-like ER degradation enhancer 1
MFRVIRVESSLTEAQATRDPFYLDIGKTVFSDLLLRAKVECGIAGIEDLRTNALEDRMESFVLSETLKVRSYSPIHRPIVNRRALVSLFAFRRR